MPGKVNLTDVFASQDRLSTLIAATGWDVKVVADALSACGKTVAHLIDERVVETIERVIQLGGRIGAPPTELKEWVNRQPDETQAQAVVNAVKAKYDDSSWLDIARAINDPLRERQRDALVAFVLTMPGIRGKADMPNELF